MDAIVKPAPRTRRKAPATQDLPYSDAMAAHYYTHDRAIKMANWAMKEDPDCVSAHSRYRTAEIALDNSPRSELAAARVELADAKKAWTVVTTDTFNAVMTEQGFGWMLGGTDDRLPHATAQGTDRLKREVPAGPRSGGSLRPTAKSLGG